MVPQRLVRRLVWRILGHGLARPLARPLVLGPPFTRRLRPGTQGRVHPKVVHHRISLKGRHRLKKDFVQRKRSERREEQYHQEFRKRGFQRKVSVRQGIVRQERGHGLKGHFSDQVLLKQDIRDFRGQEIGFQERFVKDFGRTAQDRI